MRRDNIDQVYLNVFKGNNEKDIKEEDINEISNNTNRYKGLAFVMIFILLVNAFGALISLLPSYFQSKKIYLSFSSNSKIRENIKAKMFMNNLNIKVEKIDDELKTSILDKKPTLGKKFIYWNSEKYDINSNILTGYIDEVLSGNIVELNKNFCELNKDHKNICNSIGINFN